MKQYISALNPEAALANAAVIYGLNLYLLSLTNPVDLVYNGYTIESNIELSYVPKELNGWDRAERDWMKFWQTPFGKTLSIGLFVAATVIAILVPELQPIYIGWVIGTVVSLGIGGAIAGYRRKKNGGDFWRGFENYINENWSQTLAINMVLVLVTFGISLAVSAVKNAATANKALANAATEPVKTTIPNQLNPESYAKAIEGNPTFDTFRKRYWKAEAARAPELYGKNVTQMLKGNAPIIDGERLVLHHVAGRKGGNLYNVVVLPESQHIAFHKMYGYYHPENWPNLWE